MSAIQPAIRSAIQPAVRSAVLSYGSLTAWTPTSLFAASEVGVWYDPSDLTAEKIAWRRNLLTYSEQFDTAVWTKQAGAISANSTTAPDGKTTADTFVEDATGVGHYFTYALTPAMAAGAGSYVLGAYFKQAPGATRYGRISANGDWGGHSANVNLSTGEVTNVAGTGTWTATSVGSGWWRFSCVFTAAGGNTGTIFITMSDSPTGSASYTGDGTSGIYIWGAQLETGSTATAYQRITDFNSDFIAAFPQHTLFQDSAGATPVTAVGQPVGLILDKSAGLVLGPDLVTNGDFSAGLTGWTGSSYTASGGVVTQTGTSSLTQVAVVQSGTWYRVSIDVTEVTASGGCSFQLGGVNGAQFSVTTTGTVTQYLLATVTGSLSFVHRGGATFRGSLDNFSCKVLLGNHAYQATDASRPILGRTPATGQRNLLTYTEDFATQWSNVNTTETVNAVVAPDGTTTADRAVETSALGTHIIQRSSLAVTNGVAVVASVYAKAGERNIVQLKLAASFAVDPIVEFDLSLGTSTTRQGTLTKSITDVGGGWYRWAVASTPIAAGNTTLQVLLCSAAATTNYTGDITKGVYVWGAQLEAGSTATAYQKVTAAYDVTEAGVADCYNLWFDGVDDGLATAAIDFTATDEMSVFAGLRKANDVAGIVAELSTNMNSNAGAFYFVVNDGFWDWASKSRGDSSESSSQMAYITEAGPATAVIATTHDISGDLTTLRKNGVAATSATGNKGLGNFGNYVLYIGRRAGASVPLNGNIYSLTVLGRTATAAEITAAESYAAGKCGVTL